MPLIGYSHSGGTNSAGCHNNHSNGTYHCHNSGSTVTSTTYSWYASNWSSCTGDCGTGNGTQTRTVYCKSSTGSVVSNSYCSSSTPSSSTSCTASTCPVITYTWNTGDWGQCSGECGTNNSSKSRVVNCLSSEGSEVSDSNCTDSKPSESTSCTSSTCPVAATFTNHTGIVYLPNVLVSSQPYEVYLGLDNETACFKLNGYTMLNTRIDDSPSTFNTSTRLLHIPSIEVNSEKVSATFEQSLSNAQFCLTDSYQGDCSVTTKPYNRSDWNHWVDYDGDCQNTRVEILAANNLASPSSECTISTGNWYGIYTGQSYTNASDLDIDHIVSLHWAHNHGGANWSSSLKEMFANDTENLLPVYSGANASKGSKGPDEWLPDHNQCSFIDKWNAVVDKYNLCLSTEESQLIETTRLNCQN